MTPQTTDGQGGTRRLPARFIPAPSAHASLSSPLPPRAELVVTQKLKLFDQVRVAIRLRHYSLRTEDTYLHWIKRFIVFHGKRHPAEISSFTNLEAHMLIFPGD